MTTPSRSLQHRFVVGLGFRTRWTYRACGGRERWLPASQAPASEDGGWIAAQQATALFVGAVPRSARGRRPSLDEQALAGLLKDWIPNAVLHASTHAPTSTATGQAFILDALSARITAGHLVLLRYAIGERSPRWCLVGGVETAALTLTEGPPVPSTDRVPALLLLDSAVPPVWGCGYNARLEAAAEHVLRRTLDGCLAQLRLVSWLAVQVPRTR